MRLALLLGLAVLSGCVSAEQRLARDAAEAEAVAAADKAHCESIGAPFGTSAHIDCRIARDQARAVRSAAYTQAAGAYWANQPFAYRPYQYNLPQPTAPVYQTPITTTCGPSIGGYVNCTSR